MRTGVRHVLNATTLLAVLLARPVAAHGEAPTIEDVQAGWKRIQSRHPIGRIEWTEYLLRPKGYLFDSTPDHPNPAQDMKFTNDGTLAWGNKRFYSRYRVRGWNFDKKQFETIEFQNVSGGRTGTRQLERLECLDHQQGYIYKSSTLSDADQHYVHGILLWINPELAFGADLKGGRTSIDPSATTIHSHPCIALTSTPSIKSKRIFYLDASHDFRILRYEDYQHNEIMRSTDIQYPQDATPPGQQATPLIHTTAYNRVHKLLYDSRLKVTQARLDLESIPDDQFDLRFPAGTIVLDTSTGEHAVVEGSNEHLRALSKDRPIRGNTDGK